MEIFFEFSIILLIALIVSVLVRLLRQPSIIGYILSGVIVGPYLLNIFKSQEIISFFSEIGVAFLLFIVGLNLNPRVIRQVGRVSIVTGLGQVVFTSVIGFGICRLLGFPWLESLYISVALTFSSTIIIMKLLSDKGDLDTLYGRIAIGFLIVQDIVAVLALMAISSMQSGLSWQAMLIETLLKGVGVVGLVLLFGFYALPAITRFMARSQELLLLFSIAWVLALASLFHFLGFSIEIGALLAGVTLSLSPFRFEISSKMAPVRDFFIILFFISLGTQLGFSGFSQIAIPIAILSLFVLVGNPIIVMILMGLLGYNRRNGFLAGLTVAQISEFSLVLIAMGIKVGHLGKETLSLVTYVGLITIAGSSYLIVYANRIYPLLSKYLRVFERKGRKVDEHRYHGSDSPEVILFGYNRIGFDILSALKRTGHRFLVIDHNPDRIMALAREGISCRYGDANDLELLNELNLRDVKMLISTVPELETNLMLINLVREVNRFAIIMVVSHQIKEAIELYEHGASYVIMPHFLGGRHTSSLIERHRLDEKAFNEEKTAHLADLLERQLKGQEHPANLRQR